MRRDKASYLAGRVRAIDEGVVKVVALGVQHAENRANRIEWLVAALAAAVLLLAVLR